MPEIQQDVLASQVLSKERVNPINIGVLLDPEFEDVTESDLMQMIQEAVEIINKNTQNYLVKEDLTLVVLRTAARTGRYVGKWEGKHHVMITVSGKEILTDPKERMSLILTICHELFHQKFAEILGITDPNGTGIEAKLQHYSLQGKSDFQRARMLTFSGRAKASFLQKTLNEGFAVYGELQLFEALLGGEELTPEQRAAVFKCAQERLRDITEKKERPSTYQDGFILMTGLLKETRVVELLELVAQIDWESCGQIESDTTQYRETLHNPRLILK